MPAIVAVERVTPEWLTAVLSAAGHDGRVDEFSCEHIGTGQVGDNVRFRLAYASGTGPQSIIGKFASRDPVSRATGIAQNTYIKEVRFYREIKPTVGIRTPTPMFADIDPTTHTFCIMMEDLYPALQGDQIAGCTPDQAAIAVTELANLHAPRWNDPALARMEWLNTTDPNAPGAGQALYRQLVAGFRDRYRDGLEPSYMAVAEAFADRFAAWAGGYVGPRAIVHGDYRLDNMLFGGRYPVAVVDWQTFSIGAPASDLSYFIGAGLVPELRRAHERELVRHYHEALVRAGIEDYPFEDCWRDYRRYSYSGLVMAVVASMIVGRTERGDAMFMAMASRHAQQALDLETDALIDA